MHAPSASISHAAYTQYIGREPKKVNSSNKNSWLSFLADR
jgi:hypothetical protein